MGEYLKLVGDDAVFSRNRVIEGVRAVCADDAPFIVLSKDTEGKLYFAATHGGGVILDLLDQAQAVLDGTP